MTSHEDHENDKCEDSSFVELPDIDVDSQKRRDSKEEHSPLLR